MTGPGGDGFLVVLETLQAALQRAKARFMVIGGVAVMARGIPRTTIDIDATVEAEGLDIAGLFDVLAEHDFEPRIPDPIGFARNHQVLLLRHSESGVPVDISLAWLPFEVEAIAHGEEVCFAGITIRVPRSEDLIIYKMVALRPRDIDDAEKLLLLHSQEVSLDRLRAVVSDFARALDDVDRPAVLERLIAKTSRGT